jgi:hypothetical protein
MSADLEQRPVLPGAAFFQRSSALGHELTSKRAAARTALRPQADIGRSD